MTPDKPASDPAAYPTECPPPAALGKWAAAFKEVWEAGGKVWDKVPDEPATPPDVAAALATVREALTVVDECYVATGHIRVAPGSEQRKRLTAALAVIEKSLGFPEKNG